MNVSASVTSLNIPKAQGMPMILDTLPDPAIAVHLCQARTRLQID